MASEEPTRSRSSTDASAGAVRWLDEREQTAWLAYLEGSMRFQDRLDADLKSRFGLTLEDYEILVVLSDQPDHRLRMSEIADRILSSRSRLTYRIDRMERAGRIVRVPCPSDGRAIWAQLTDAGFELLERAAPIHVEGVRRFLIDHFEPEEWVRLGERFSEIAAGLCSTDSDDS